MVVGCAVNVPGTPILQRFRHILTLARIGGGCTPPLRFFADSEKNRLPYGANLAQFLEKKN